MSRRNFIKTAFLTGCSVLIPSVPLATYAIFPSLKKGGGSWIDFGPVEDLESDNFNMLSYEFMVKDGWITLPQRGFVWAKMEAGKKIKIFSSTCSHLACNVIWQEETNEFICPCHSGRFDSQGNPIAGPPSRPLATLDHKIEEDNLHIFMQV
jgi:Rieske Fe-S protein